LELLRRESELERRYLDRELDRELRERHDYDWRRREARDIWLDEDDYLRDGGRRLDGDRDYQDLDLELDLEIAADRALAMRDAEDYTPDTRRRDWTSNAFRPPRRRITDTLSPYYY
jgi:hypothetical protein